MIKFGCFRIEPWQMFPVWSVQSFHRWSHTFDWCEWPQWDCPVAFEFANGLNKKIRFIKIGLHHSEPTLGPWVVYDQMLVLFLSQMFTSVMIYKHFLFTPLDNPRFWLTTKLNHQHQQQLAMRMKLLATPRQHEMNHEHDVVLIGHKEPDDRLLNYQSDMTIKKPVKKNCIQWKGLCDKG